MGFGSLSCSERSGCEGSGLPRRVLVLFKDDIEPRDLERLRQALRDGKAGPVDIIHGTQKITEYFRDFFRNAL